MSHISQSIHPQHAPQAESLHPFCYHDLHQEELYTVQESHTSIPSQHYGHRMVLEERYDSPCWYIQSHHPGIARRAELEMGIVERSS